MRIKTEPEDVEDVEGFVPTEPENMEGFVPDGRQWTLTQGCTYRAVISLGFFERLVGNDYIAGMFQKNGFMNVSVTGSGSNRTVTGTWAGSNVTVPLDSHITSVTLLHSPQTNPVSNT
jgi:hypothetical protein